MATAKPVLYLNGYSQTRTVSEWLQPNQYRISMATAKPVLYLNGYSQTSTVSEYLAFPRLAQLSGSHYVISVSVVICCLTCSVLCAYDGLPGFS